jgi:formylglycine-generating enzyme
MKRKLGVSVLFLTVTMMLTACAPASSETTAPTQPPVRVESTATSPVPPDTEVPPPISTESTVPTLAPAYLMEVGSTFPYVDGSVLVAVPAGKFVMGADKADNPEHVVTLGDFWIQSTMVTNQQYVLCVELGQCAPPDLNDNLKYKDVEYANNPVVGVTYDQAVAYCSFVHGRLPTEAEWEKAARGPDGNIYPWGDGAPSCDLLNFFSCVGKTTNVTSHLKGASYYGGLDFAGNAFEWVADWYDPKYYGNSPEENPPGPASGTKRSIRSSGYKSEAYELAVTNRRSEDPQVSRSDLGFRCAVDDPTYFAPFCEAAPVYGQVANPASAQQTGPSESCPLLDISQSKYCDNQLSTTRITFKGPVGSAIDPKGCLPTGDPYVFICQSKDLVSISASCQVGLTGDPACPSGYTLDGSICRANGTPGACLAGMNHDSAQNCCADGPSAGLPACPVGTFYLATQNVCTPNPLHGVVSVVQLVEFVSCEAGSGGGATGACAPKPCNSPGAEWEPDLCCCTISPGTCYDPGED